MSLANFRFNISQWSECVLPQAPPTPYSGVRMAVDTAFFANETSDESAYSVGFQGDDFSFTLLGADSGRWKGIALPNKIVDAIETWSPEQVWVERTTGAPDLLVDCIKIECEARQISLPHITFFTPRESKATRVFKLQAIVESHQLRICPGAYTSTLLAQARDFDFSSPKQNHRREDGMLDSLASNCFAATF